ncbi:MarR family winged helix-turn-helix transcriptional regulator [Edaphobacter sp.]|uniref:MarR family winged helix-turn-helix transcriptional regulator n=1 Tax=Edaphobacter sp. TaxID=1934404 RepID=UPI002DC062C9|nr:MarR family transcriptional regulator [Edaphobacter sp.]HEU5342420.1 MarR family transcriptional regulator [Edaphobacter sp.]
MRIESFLQQSPVFQISRAARRIEAALNQTLGEEELTFFESLVLTAVFFEKKGVKPSALADAFETTRGNVSHCVSSLEAKGLVKRRIDPNDARALQIALLPAGRKRAVRVAAILDRMQRRFEEGMGTAELDGMLGLMHAVEELCSGLAVTANWKRQKKSF